MNSYEKKETLCYIVADFYDDHVRQTYFYERFRDQLGGFPGVRHFLMEAADAFIYWESRMKVEWDGEFADATEAFADALLGVEEIPNQQQLRAIAKRVIDAQVVKIKAAFHNVKR